MVLAKGEASASLFVFRYNYNLYYEEVRTLKNKIKIGSIKEFILPAILGVAAFYTAIADKKKEEKIDQLIEKVDQLENKGEA